MRKAKRGKIVIISSPSGGGKTSICRKLLSPARRRRGWTFSVSYTTRTKRPGERDGREYYFVSDEKFNSLANKGFFAEHCRVHRYQYGTPHGPLQRVLKTGGVILLDVDVQGARKLQKAYPDAITIFVLPPSLPELKHRLRLRGTETAEQMQVRFENARREMRYYRRFDYVVINKELRAAVSQVLQIIGAHDCRTDRGNMEQIESIVS